MTKNFYNKVLDKEQAKQIHENALRIMSEIGMDIYNDKALDLLCSAGAKKTGDRRVKIPVDAVEKSLKSAPNRIDIYDRNGSPRMTLEGNNSYYGTGAACPYIMDPYTRERRLFTRKDCVNGSILCDYLENIDFLMSMGTISDVNPPENFEIDAFYSMISNTDKPLIVEAVKRDDLSVIFDITCMLTGGEKAFKEKPIYAQYCEPSTPLKHSKTALEKVIFCSEKHIPLIYTPCPSAGGTTPVTLAGMLSVGTAEILTGLIINQTVSKGAPFIYGGVFSILDMRTTNFSYAAPEFLLCVAAVADMAHYYNLPNFSTGGVCDSKTFDAQASGEYALSNFVSYMSGGNLIHDVGFLEFALTQSFEGILYTNEIAGMIKRMDRGIKVDADTLAFDVIKETGVGGLFLSSEHTLKHFKTEHWTPSLLDRTVYSQWAERGKKDFSTVLNEKVKHIIENHKGHKLEPSLDKEIRNKLSKYYDIERQ